MVIIDTPKNVGGIEMPIPLIAWVVVTGALGALGALGAMNGSSRKTIAVLGERSVGKTTLIKFLETKEIHCESKQTIHAQKFKGIYDDKENSSKKLKFETLDLPGSDTHLWQWKEQFEKADFVIYLVRVDWLMKENPTVEKLVADHAEHFKSWLDAINKNKQKRRNFYIIGTHSDCDEEYAKLDSSNRGDFHDKFYKLLPIQKFIMRIGGHGSVEIELGSMKTQAEAKQLVCRILKKEGI